MKRTSGLSHGKPGLEAERGGKDALAQKCLCTSGQRPARRDGCGSAHRCV